MAALNSFSKHSLLRKIKAKKEMRNSYRRINLHTQRAIGIAEFVATHTYAAVIVNSVLTHNTPQFGKE